MESETKETNNYENEKRQQKQTQTFMPTTLQ